MEIDNNESRILPLEEMIDLITRPLTRNCVEEGVRKGTIESVALKEVYSKFSDSGKRIVLCIKVVVEDEDGEEVPLYMSPNLTWSSKGKMLKILQDIECLPEAGERLDIDAMVGMKVKVLIENVQKDGVEYSNITGMKRVKESKLTRNKKRKLPLRKTVVQQEDTDFEDLNDERFNDIEEDFEI